jgi:hypothetical protein
MKHLFARRRRKSRKRRPAQPRPQRQQWGRDLRLMVAAHPQRTVVLVALGLLLAAFIARSSLPMALATSYPQLALFLYEDHPKALLTLALQERRAISAATKLSVEEAVLTRHQPENATAHVDSAPAGGALVDDHLDAISGAPVDAEGAVHGGPQPEAPPGISSLATGSENLPALRAGIRQLAGRVIAQDPLNATAYRLLGETIDDPEASRGALIEAVARSRRESLAAFLLLHQAHEKGNYAEVVRLADVLLLTQPALNRFTLSYLYSLVLVPEGREAVAETLARNPSWRWIFFASLGGQTLAASDEPLALLQQLRSKGGDVSEAELAPILWTRMAADKSAGGAYNTWLQLLSPEEMAEVRPVNNLDFSRPPGRQPFNWTLSPSANVVVDFQLPVDAQERILRIRFGVGQVTFGGLLQVTFLSPGVYRFSGLEKGNMAAKRGLRWQMTCFAGPLAGTSNQLFGAPRDWREFSFDLAIPDDGSCDAQRLRLIHDARSASERFASGEILFRSLRIRPAEVADPPSLRKP